VVKKSCPGVYRVSSPHLDSVELSQPKVGGNLKLILHSAKDTAFDAIEGGIKDWLISSFMISEQDKVRPLIYSTIKAKTSCLEVLLSEPQGSDALVFKDVNDVTMTDYGNSSTNVKVSCDEKSLPEHLEVIANNKFAQLSSTVTKLNDLCIPGVGMGRLLNFEAPLPLYEIVQRTKTHLDSTYIRLGLSPKHTRDAKVAF